MAPIDRAASIAVTALRTSLSELGGLAEQQLSWALDAVRRRDMELARRVVGGDGELDRRETAVEEQALRTLAFRQPLAQDLRETVATLKIATTLERVGDLAKNIARRVEVLLDVEPPRVETAVLRMGQLAQSQLSDALDAYGAQDTAAAIELWRRDVELDDLYNSVFRDIIMEMTRSPGMIGYGAQLMFIAKNLERVGDHTTFIAEMTYYVAIGQPLGDARPKGVASYSGRLSPPEAEDAEE